MEATDQIWLDHNDTPIPVGAMTEEHVRNTLRLILRNFPDISHHLENKPRLEAVEVNALVTHQITKRRIADLLGCGFEGGVGYWGASLTIEEFIKPTGKIVAYNCMSEDDSSSIDGHHRHPAFPVKIYPHIDYPLNETGGLMLIEEEKSGLLDKPFFLDWKAIQKGMQVFATKYPKHFANFIAENEDADTGDCFIQTCVYGEVIFG